EPATCTRAAAPLAYRAPPLPAMSSKKVLALTKSGPSVATAPPRLPALARPSRRLTFWRVSVPWLTMRPPLLSPEWPLASTMFLTVNEWPRATENRRAVLVKLPLRVMRLAPSRVVLWLMACSVRRTMVLGPPQLKVTLPPPERAAARAASVQLSEVP